MLPLEYQFFGVLCKSLLLYKKEVPLVGLYKVLHGGILTSGARILPTDCHLTTKHTWNPLLAHVLWFMVTVLRKEPSYEATIMFHKVYHVGQN